MGFLDELKRLARPYAEEDDDDFEDFESTPRTSSRSSGRERSSSSRDTGRNSDILGSSSSSSASSFGGSGSYSSRDSVRDKVVNIHTTTQLQVVLRRPERFKEDALEIADHLREKHTVVLNLENTNKDVARRLVDFFSGVAYALDGKIEKVAVSTYIITPYNVEILGDLIGELGNSGVYFE